MVKTKRKLNKEWLIEASLLEGVVRNMAEARPVRHTHLWTAFLVNSAQGTLCAANDEVFDV